MWLKCILEIVLIVYISQMSFLNLCGGDDGGVQVVSAIPNHLDGRSAPGQVPTGSVCYDRNGVCWAIIFLFSLEYTVNPFGNSIGSLSALYA